MARKGKSKKKGLYKEPKHRDIAKVITFESIPGARKATRILLGWIRKCRRKKALAILRSLNYAANRAKVTARTHPTFSSTIRKKWLQISKIYRRAFEKARKIYQQRFKD